MCFESERLRTRRRRSETGSHPTPFPVFSTYGPVLATTFLAEMISWVHAEEYFRFPLTGSLSPRASEIFTKSRTCFNQRPETKGSVIIARPTIYLPAAIVDRLKPIFPIARHDLRNGYASKSTTTIQGGLPLIGRGGLLAPPRLRTTKGCCH